jgi:DNA modification methylase
VFRVGDGPHQDNVQQGRFGRNRSNVWTYAGVNGFRAGRLDDLSAHPTVKPVQLVADALKDVTRRGDIVLDSFVGSGTTILAAEKVGRRARTVEIEPRYAQIAVRRWEAMTGRAAVHAESGVELDQLGGMREPPKSLPRARVRTRTLA